jgi:hypothetical protein
VHARCHSWRESCANHQLSARFTWCGAEDSWTRLTYCFVMRRIRRSTIC